MNIILIIIVIGLLIYSFAPQLFDKDVRLAPSDCTGRYLNIFGLNICFVGDNSGTNKVQLHLEKSLISEGPNEQYLQINSEAPKGVKIAGYNYISGGVPTEVPTNVLINGSLYVNGENVTFINPSMSQAGRKWAYFDNRNLLLNMQIV